MKSELDALTDPARAEGFSRFFQTGKGGYGEGDRFIGLTVPQVRSTIVFYRKLPLADVATLLESRIHEHRLAALLILVWKFGRADDVEKERLRNFYLANSAGVNNWDLVDTSAPYLFPVMAPSHWEARLDRLAKSDNVWLRRIAIVSSLGPIRTGHFERALRLSESLMQDRHPLIHKASGWMLREVGKRSPEALRGFLDRFAGVMPRTALRYALERLPEKERRAYMNVRSRAASGLG